LVESGTYTAEANGAALTITTSGTATAPIIYEAAPGAHPVIDVPASAWGGILENASNIVVNGFEIAGNARNVTLAYAQSQETNLNDPTTSADGIDVGYMGDTNTPQHVTIENNSVHDMPGGGIVSMYSDYITIQGNTVADNAHYAPFGSSGISLGFSQNSDTSTATKNFIIGNTSYGNSQLVPTASTGTITDGEGIIVDDNSNDQTNNKQYLGGTLIENNLTYLNGGPGIEPYDSSNVSILYNTTYSNGKSGIDPYEVFLDRAKDSMVENNIMSALAGGQTGGTSSSTATTWDYNLLYGGPSGITGANDKTGNPLFVNPGAAGFMIGAGSPAIGAANAALADATDLAGTARTSKAMDMGAYQHIASTPSPPPVTPVTPPSTTAASPNGTMIVSSSGSPIIDHSGNSWTLVPSSTQGLQIAVNGTVDTVTTQVLLLETLDGNMVQENSSGNWYSEPGPSGPWSQIASPSIHITNTRSGTTTAVDVAKTGTVTAGGATFVMTAPGVTRVSLGWTPDRIQFVGTSSVSLTGGTASVSVVDTGGNNTFTGAYGSLAITGGVGSDSYIYHKGDGMMTVNDFSGAKGDSLTVDKGLQGAMTEASDGHGGVVVGFGTIGRGVDLIGVATLPASQIHFA